MKLSKIFRLLFAMILLSLYTLNIYSQELSNFDDDLLKLELETPEDVKYDKSLFVDAFFYNDLRLYTLRYNLELLKGKNLSFNGNIGFGVIDQMNPVITSGKTKELDVVIPLEASLLIGKKKHFLELGLGAHVLFGLEKTEESLSSVGESGILIGQYQAEQEGTSLWLYSDIAYRYQPKEDGSLFMRVGVMPTMQSYNLAGEVDFNIGFRIGIGYLIQ
ncbi:MAG: hypothetical protein R3E32_00895 [Chitinophagales bacterium]